jgi:serine/threonine-protein kinase
MSAFGAAQLPKPGDTVDGKYRLEHLLGKGGMGAVFAARHIKLGHAVAIKVMLADSGNAEAAQRFVNEGRAAANIQSDHVVRVSDVDEEHGYAFMVLELLDGDDLAQVLEQQGPLPPHVAVGYVMQALEGVKQAHAQGIVHRDLKPSNLFLARRPGGSVVVKVLDFGISKANHSSVLGMAPSELTSTAAMLGSPRYMSPEQLRSSKKVDARADIWAIGVILYELLTGTLPFEGEHLGALFSAILETDAPRVSARVPNVPPGLDAIVARCLERRVEDRFQDVGQVVHALAPFADPTTASTHTVHGTVPLGAVTPQPQLQPQRQTGNAWQSTGSRAKPKRSGVVLAFGVVSALFLVGALGLGLVSLRSWKARHASEHTTGTGASASASPPPSALVTPDPSAVAPAVASTPPAVASSAPAPKRPPAAAATVVKLAPPKVEAPKVEPPQLGTLQPNR